MVMRLSFEQIKRISIGAEDVVLHDRGIEFERFNNEEKVLYATSPLATRTQTPAGVELVFKTDGDRICIKIETELCSDRHFFCLDIIEDGNLTGYIKNYEDEQMTGFYSGKQFPQGVFENVTDLKSGTKEIRIVLPWSVRVFLKELIVENASFVTPVKKDKTMLVYGDSITHGYDALHPSNTYVSRLGSYLGCKTMVKAVGGEKFWPALSGVKNAKTPDCITVAYGTNDWGANDKAAFDKNCPEFLDNLRRNYPNTPIFVISPIWRKDNTLENSVFDSIFYIAQKLEEICNSMDNTVYIDGWNFVPHDETFYGDLRLHPTDKGFEHYFNNLVKYIRI